MDGQHRIVVDLIEQLEEADADFTAHLREEAERALEAREESSD
jgi:hypothetical protein